MIPSGFRLWHGVITAISLAVAGVTWAAGADPPKKAFQLAGGDAAVTLKQFSQQSGEQIVYPTDAVRGVQTNPVHGLFSAREALDRMVANTALTAYEEEKTGALTVKRRSPRPPPSANPRRPSSLTDPREEKQTLADSPAPMKNGTPAVALGGAIALALAPIPGSGAESSSGQGAVTLSPFEVTSTKDTGFAAASSLAGGRLAGELRDTPVAYSVMTREFIDALGIIDLQEATTWSTGNGEALTTGTDNFNSNTGQYTTRGFNSASQASNGGNRQRNFFPMLSFGDSYNLERYDFGRGPNSILFGNGTLGGTSSATSKRAQTNRSFQTIKFGVGSWNNFRSELDLNQAVPDKKTAVRVSLLWQDSDTWRMNEFDNRRGAFLTTTLKPYQHTEIRLEGEYFKGARQRGATDINDGFSGWDGVTTYNSPMPLATLPANANAVGVGRFAANYFVYDPFGPANAIMNYANDATTLGGGATATTPIAGFTQVGTAFNSSAATLTHAQNVPAGRFNTAIAKSFFRPVSDAYTTAPDGPEQTQYFRDAQLTVRQQLGDNFFLELAGDVNTSDLLINRNSTANAPLQAILIDINRVLPNGAPNPNFLQPYSGYGNTNRIHASNDNHSLRGAAAYVIPANRFGTFALNAIGGLSHRERNQDYRFLSLNQGTDHRQWGNPATQTVRIRRYWNAPSRPGLGDWGSHGRDLGETSLNFIDPVTSVSRVVQPRWTLDDDTAANQSLDHSDFRYVLASLNARFFKERLVLLGAVRYDKYKFGVDIQKSRGDYPLDWTGDYRLTRPAAPADYFALTYQPKDAAGVPNAPVQTAITRPRIAATGERNPLYLNDRFQDDYNAPALIGSQTTRSFGSVLHLFSWFNPSFNFSETFNPPNGLVRINGQLQKPTVASGSDYGLRMELFQRRLDLNFIYYEAKEINASDISEAPFFNQLINANAVGDFSATGTNIQGVAALPASFRDSQSRRAQGFEIEVACNPTKAIRLTGNFSRPKTGTSNRYPDWLAYISANSTAFKRIAQDAGALIDANNVASVDQSVPIDRRSPDVQLAVNAYNAIYQFQNTWSGRGATLEEDQVRANLFADYTFQSGFLQRLRVGAGVRYYGKDSIGTRANDSIVNPANRLVAIDDPAVDATTRVYRPDYSIVTGTLAYSWKLKDRRELQANLVVNNLLNDRGPLYFNTILRPKGGDYTSPARETVPNLFALKKPISYNLTLTVKL